MVSTKHVLPLFQNRWLDFVLTLVQRVVQSWVIYFETKKVDVCILMSISLWWVDNKAASDGMIRIHAMCV